MHILLVKAFCFDWVKLISWTLYKSILSWGLPAISSLADILFSSAEKTEIQLWSKSSKFSHHASIWSYQICWVTISWFVISKDRLSILSCLIQLLSHLCLGLAAVLCQIWCCLGTCHISSAASTSNVKSAIVGHVFIFFSYHKIGRQFYSVTSFLCQISCCHC